MLDLLREKINAQRKLLMEMLRDRMSNASARISALMDDRQAMESLLVQELAQMQYCKHLFVLDASCIQLTANIRRDDIDVTQLARNRADRGYMQGIAGATDFKLSDAYISKNKKRPSLTAVHVIKNHAGELLGFLGADYDIRELPHTEQLYKQPASWQQLKGDPSIRQGLFAQCRSQSVIDTRIDDVLALMNELITEHGVFHGKIHFSSNRATIWLFDDPYNYRLLGLEEITSPNICLAYPRRPYPARAVIPAEKVADLLEQLKLLRFADDVIYLRSGSINVCNGMLGLNFSCDGSHYMYYEEFIEKDMDFWYGMTCAV